MAKLQKSHHDQWDLREALGRRVHQVHVNWLKTQEDLHPEALASWPQMDESTREANRLIGEAIWLDCMAHHAEAIAEHTKPVIANDPELGGTWFGSEDTSHTIDEFAKFPWHRLTEAWESNSASISQGGQTASVDFNPMEPAISFIDDEGRRDRWAVPHALFAMLKVYELKGREDAQLAIRRAIGI